jgi:hypothetical protein
LPYPLKQPVTDITTVGVETPQAPTVTWVTSDPNKRVTVELELSLNEYVALATSLDVGRDIAYSDESEYIWWLWTRAFIRTASGEPVQPLIETIIQTIKIHAPVYVMVESEQDKMLKIEIIDGKPFLEEDCGCGERRYYTLTGASINPQTGAISDVIDTVPEYVSDIPLLPEQIADCYSAKVAQIITDSLVAYTPAIFQYALAGAAAFAPVQSAALIGAIEIQQSIVAALSGNLTLDLSNVGYTANEVIASFRSDAFQQFLIDRLGDDQQIARWVLQAVSLRLLNRSDLNFPTPTYPIFQAWVAMANMSALNQALELAASECQSGNSLPDGFLTEQQLLDRGYAWAHSFDLRVAPMVENASFDLQIGDWVEGVGYVGECDVPHPPHSGIDLDFQLTQTGAGGGVRYAALQYQYTPQSGSTLRRVFGDLYDADEPFSGILELESPSSNVIGTNVETLLTPLIVLNSATACGVKPVVSKIAVAGISTDLYPDLLQDV